MDKRGYVRIAPDYVLRGWQGLPYTLVRRDGSMPGFMTYDVFRTVQFCNGHFKVSSPVFLGARRKHLEELDKIDGEALFEATVASAAAEVGLPFTYEEFKEQANGRELDDAELEAVAGGGGECALIGFTDDAECECSKSGQVCAFLGITF